MQNSGQQQVLFHCGNYLVRRQMLQPGEATPSHTDSCHRVTVVLSDDLLSIEYRDGTEALSCKVTPVKLIGRSRAAAFTAPSIPGRRSSRRS